MARRSPAVFALAALTSALTAHAGNIAYCPNADAVPSPGVTSCMPIPAGLPAPIPWWTHSIGYHYLTCNGWWDDDLGVAAGNTIVLPHDSEYLGQNSSYAYNTCVGAWGYGPTFRDLVTGVNFHFNHLRPGWQPYSNAAPGTVFQAGSFVGRSGGNTCETGYCTCALDTCCASGSCPLEAGGWASCDFTRSTAAHLCVVTDTSNLTNVFGTGAVPTCVATPTPLPQQLACSAPVDFDGDGRGDLFFHWSDSHDWVGLSSAAGFAWGEWSAQFPLDLGADADQGAIRVGDFTGDGRTDVAFHWNDGHDWVGASSGTGLSWNLWNTSWAMNLGADANQAAIRVGDFNGDGRADLYFHWSDGNDWVGLSTGSGFTWERWGSSWAMDLGTDLDQGAIRVGDFNGDGLSDLYFHWYDGNDWVGLSTGSGFTWVRWGTSWAMNLGTDTNQGAIRVGDFNGDGLSDLAFHWYDGNDWVGLSTGSGFTWVRWGTSWAMNLGADTNQGAIRVGDFNGDGLSDLAFHWNDGHDWVGVSSGASISWGQWASSWAMNLGTDLDQGAIQVSDFNGDGLSDLYFHWSDGNEWVAYSSGSSLTWSNQVGGNKFALELGNDANSSAVRAGTRAR